MISPSQEELLSRTAAYVEPSPGIQWLTTSGSTSSLSAVTATSISWSGSYAPSTSYAAITGASTLSVATAGTYDLEFGIIGETKRAQGIHVAPNGAGLTAADSIAAALGWGSTASDNTSVTVTFDVVGTPMLLLPNQSLTAGSITFKAKLTDPGTLGSVGSVVTYLWARLIARA